MASTTLTSTLVAYLDCAKLKSEGLRLRKENALRTQDDLIINSEKKILSFEIEGYKLNSSENILGLNRANSGARANGHAEQKPGNKHLSDSAKRIRGSLPPQDDCKVSSENSVHNTISCQRKDEIPTQSSEIDWFHPRWLYEEESFTPEPSPQNKKEESTRLDRSPAETSCHHVADSLFSTSSGFNDYRGLLNLCIILLVLSNTRAALENIIKYGILIDPLLWLTAVLKEPYSWPSFTLVMWCNAHILISFWVEKLLAWGSISEGLGNILNGVNIFLEITLPALVVLWIHPSPIFSSIALAICTVVFLKLISYTRVNAWCRENLREPRMKRIRTKSVGDMQKMTNGHAENLQQYPNNLNLYDMYYFMVAPALCYELNFPKSGRVRKRFLIKRALEMAFLFGLMISLIQQWIIPTVNNSMQPFHELRGPVMIARLLKLAVPNHLIWLIFFYWFFHSCLNVVAELLRFGDRVFYRDWWNAETVQYFWQNWNIPVHRWALRHLYKPMLSSGYSKMQASLAVFIASAFFHEYLVSVPLRMFRLWSFSAMLGQLPLAYVTTHFLNGGKMGNMAVWMSIIIGQPVAILMYYHDYYIIHYQ